MLYAWGEKKKRKSVQRCASMYSKVGMSNKVVSVCGRCLDNHESTVLSWVSIRTLSTPPHGMHCWIKPFISAFNLLNVVIHFPLTGFTMSSVLQSVPSLPQKPSWRASLQAEAWETPRMLMLDDFMKIDSNHSVISVIVSKWCINIRYDTFDRFTSGSWEFWHLVEYLFYFSARTKKQQKQIAKSWCLVQNKTTVNKILVN